MKSTLKYLPKGPRIKIYKFTIPELASYLLKDTPKGIELVVCMEDLPQFKFEMVGEYPANYEEHQKMKAEGFTKY